jgi:hypothetical protein
MCYESKHEEQRLKSTSAWFDHNKRENIHTTCIQVQCLIFCIIHWPCFHLLQTWIFWWKANCTIDSQQTVIHYFSMWYVKYSTCQKCFKQMFQILMNSVFCAMYYFWTKSSFWEIFIKFDLGSIYVMLGLVCTVIKRATQLSMWILIEMCFIALDMKYTDKWIDIMFLLITSFMHTLWIPTLTICSAKNSYKISSHACCITWLIFYDWTMTTIFSSHTNYYILQPHTY